MSDLLRKLAPVKARHEELAALMAEGKATGNEFVKMTKEYSDLTPVVETIEAYSKAIQEEQDLQAMLDDPDMGEIAKEELYDIRSRIPDLEHKIKLALIPKDTDDERHP